MSDTIKLKRTKNKNNVNSTVLQDGEPLYDITNNALYIGHDNTPVSGLTPIAGGSTLTAGNGIDITDNTISVKNNTSGGLTTSSSGVAINLETTNPGLKITSNKLNTKISSSGGLTTDTNGLKIKTPTNPGLTIDADGVKVKAGTGIVVNSSGVNVNLKSNGGLSNDSGLKVNVTNGNGLSLTNGSIVMNSVTQSTSGAMNASDKVKLDGIATGATATTVSYSQNLTQGTRCGTITINGINYDIYAPSGGSVTDAANVTTSINNVALTNLFEFGSQNRALRAKLANYIYVPSTKISGANNYWTSFSGITLNNEWASFTKTSGPTFKLNRTYIMIIRAEEGTNTPSITRLFSTFQTPNGGVDNYRCCEYISTSGIGNTNNVFPGLIQLYVQFNNSNSTPSNIYAKVGSGTWTLDICFSELTSDEKVT